METKTCYYWQHGSTPDFSVNDQSKYYVTREVWGCGRRLNVEIVATFATQAEAEKYVADKTAKRGPRTAAKIAASACAILSIVLSGPKTAQAGQVPQGPLPFQTRALIQTCAVSGDGDLDWLGEEYQVPKNDPVWVICGESIIRSGAFAGNNARTWGNK